MHGGPHETLRSMESVYVIGRLTEQRKYVRYVHNIYGSDASRRRPVDLCYWARDSGYRTCAERQA